MKNRHKMELKAWAKKKQTLTKQAKKNAEKMAAIEAEEADILQRHQSELEAVEGPAKNEEQMDQTEEKDAGDDEAEQRRQKAAKKREKREEKKMKQIEAAAAAAERFEAAEKTGARADEIRALESKLLEKKLKIKDMPADGSCLFEAVSDQLSFVGHAAAGTSGSEIRTMAAQYVRDHRDDFIAFLVDEDFDEYCDKMANTNEWGGQIEIVALAKSLGSQFTIVSADGPDLIIGDAVGSMEPLTLAYHKHLLASGEHYNSVENV